MKRIKNKLRSQTGASISFALLLFLVCAVLCSVIIVAATAASGRMSGIAETDQRYYAVTSAAELMKDLISGEDNAVTTIKVTETTTTQEYKNGEATDTLTNPGDPETYIVAKPYESLNKTVDIVVSNDIVSAPINTIPMDAAKNMDSSTTLSGRELSISSDVESALSLASDPLAVTISEDLDSDGVITLTVTNNTTGGDHFTQKLVFTMNKTENSLTPEVTTFTSAPSGSGEEVTYTVMTTQKTYETTTYTWSLTSVETVSAPVSGS